jgi:hypothetical protein
MSRPTTTESEPALDVDAVMTQLMDEFKRRNGREATEDEVRQWMAQISAAIAEGGL